MRKLTDKPADDPTKLARSQSELDLAQDVFESINGRLVSEIPQLLDLRIPYLDPSFEAMVRLQIKFADDGYEKLGGVQRYFAPNVREDYANGQLDQQVEAALAEMRELSIAGLA